MIVFSETRPGVNTQRPHRTWVLTVVNVFNGGDPPLSCKSHLQLLLLGYLQSRILRIPNHYHWGLMITVLECWYSPTRDPGCWDKRPTLIGMGLGSHSSLPCFGQEALGCIGHIDDDPTYVISGYGTSILKWSWWVLLWEAPRNGRATKSLLQTCFQTTQSWFKERNCRALEKLLGRVVSFQTLNTRHTAILRGKRFE